jgi:hypothetical protein
MSGTRSLEEFKRSYLELLTGSIEGYLSIEWKLILIEGNLIWL